MNAPSPVPTTDDIRIHPGPLLLAGLDDGPGLGAHRRRHGPLPTADLASLTRWVGACGVRGRGGAGFPFATKLETVAAQGRGLTGRRRPVVVVNASEGEPASAKDTALLLTRPHLVLDGAEAAAMALGARDVHVVLPGDRPRAHHAMIRAVAERRAVAGSPVRWHTETAEARFVAGHSRAVVELLAGRPGLPVTSWQPEAVTGVQGRPTLLSNAETWAHVGLVALHGPTAYDGVGTADEPGTTLLTVTSPGQRPQVHEVAYGSRLRDVLTAEQAGAPLLLGGFHGSWVTAETVAHAPVSVPALRDLGAPLGAGVVHAPGPGRCALELTAQVVAHLAGQSAGRCGPCFNGLPALAHAVRGLVDGDPVARHRAVELVGLVERRGACAHPDGTSRLVRSLFTALPLEVAAHAAGSCATVGRVGALRVAAS